MFVESCFGNPQYPLVVKILKAEGAEVSAEAHKVATAKLPGRYRSR